MKFKVILSGILIFILSACASQAKSTPIPTVVLDTGAQAAAPSGKVSNGIVAASGIVMPEQEAKMAFTMAGNLAAVNVKEGDQVKAGTKLAELDNAAIKIQLQQAERTLKELTSPASIAAAEKELAVARQDLHDQQDKVDAQLYRRASDALIKNTEGQIELAKHALSRASDTYRSVAHLENGDSRKAAALVAMTNAQLALNNLIAKYNWYIDKPSEIDSALANAKLDVAKAAVQEAEWYLALLKGEKIPDNATGANLSRLETAKTNITSSQDLLDHSVLISPIDGTISKVSVITGETVSPGVIIFIISNVTKLHVETTDLSERDVPLVKIGQSVQISIKALNTTVAGHVTDISSVSNTIGGDVVYKTTIEFDSTPEGLRSGMSVDVQYNTGS